MLGEITVISFQQLKGGHWTNYGQSGSQLIGAPAVRNEISDSLAVARMILAKTVTVYRGYQQ